MSSSRVYVNDDDGYVAFEAAKAKAPRQENLSEKTIDKLRAARVYLSTDGKSGFLIDPDGDFVNLFNAGGVKAYRELLASLPPSSWLGSRPMWKPGDPHPPEWGPGWLEAQQEYVDSL